MLGKDVLIAAVALILIFGCTRRRSDVAGDPDLVFWAWFETNAQSLRQDASSLNVMKRVQAELRKNHPGVLAEIGSASGSRTLVLTADGERSVFPTIQRLYAKRTTVPGWEVVAFRPRQTTRPMSTITMKERTLDPSAIRYTATPDGDRLAIRLFVPGYVVGDKTLATMVFIALDHTVGEYDTETKIGGIDLSPLERAPTDARTLGDLPAQLDHREN